MREYKKLLLDYCQVPEEDLKEWYDDARPKLAELVEARKEVEREHIRRLAEGGETQKYTAELAIEKDRAIIASRSIGVVNRNLTNSRNKKAGDALDK